ncbi:cytochrome C biogenesis protein [Ktedonosporobacter rubrisoli]|uniref:Cytochrome C biogenesis protein n=1 Tax=Ktedonosporobacter rubrisoli TaxID=2509675 RepID=A0A4P6JNT9_KTERU|nr:cytochrome C biogenesis protein [Ktedonosporobacter rubrisoli]QBD76997.1 cytochrome C biogenesis protein [Ktedonosporobacter rubrisoli]
MDEIKEFKIETHIPEEYVERLRDELHLVGAGRVGNYDHCLSISQVRGYWRPLSGARPFAGTPGEICEGRECNVEVRCARQYIAEALAAIRRVHPYEEPLINVIPLFNQFFEDGRSGREREGKRE